MAFPAIQGTIATTNGTSASATATVTLPANIVAGELLLVLFRCADGTAGVSWPNGWNELVESTADASNDATAIGWRRADGTEGASIDLTITSSKYVALACRISHALAPPQFAAANTGASTTPDPPSLTPAGGVAKDYLFFWLGGWEGEQTSPPSSNPTNYASNKAGASSGTSGLTATNCRVAWATRNLNTGGAENPGTWTISASDDWTAWTLLIVPGDVMGTGRADEGDTALAPTVSMPAYRDIGVAIEADSSKFKLIKSRPKDTGLATETDEAFSTFSTVHTRAVGRADEADTPLGLGRTKPTDFASESDSSLASTRYRAKATGLSSETDESQGVTRFKRTGTGRSDEADSSFALGSGRPIGLAEEADTALAVTKKKAAATGRADEVETSLAGTRYKRAATAFSSEADSSLAVTSYKPIAAGRADEADSALGVPRLKRAATGRADEADVSLGPATFKRTTVGRSDEADTSYAEVASRHIAAGKADEADSALAPSVSHAGDISAVETDQAFARVASKQASVGTSTEADTGIQLSAQRHAASGLASETDTAFEQTIQPPSLEVGLALEADLALALATAMPHYVAVGLTEETDEALQLQQQGQVQFVPVDVALETDEATALSYAVVPHAEPQPPAGGVSYGGPRLVFRRHRDQVQPVPSAFVLAKLREFLAFFETGIWAGQKIAEPSQRGVLIVLHTLAMFQQQDAIERLAALGIDVRALY